MAVLKTWTLTTAGVGPLLSAFAEPTSMLNGVSDSIVLDQLQLPPPDQPTSMPFATVPEGGTKRFRTDTGAEIGRYFVAPTAHNGNPSRTSVDKFGNVWVGNRDAGAVGDAGGVGIGSVTKLGIIVGGTRVLADGTPSAVGEYLAPPYQYNTIVPHSGNTTGFVRTSRSFSNSLAWAGVTADSATDDAIQLYVKAGSAYTRTVACDANGDVWVGGGGFTFGDVVTYEKLDGITGASITSWTDAFARGGHGGFIGSNGYLYACDFAASFVTRMDPATGTTLYVACPGVHNICQDKNGDIWAVSFSDGRIHKFSAALVPYGGAFPLSPGNFLGRGIVARPQDDSVWVVYSDPPTIRRYTLAGVLSASITPASSNFCRGFDIDGAGNPWFSAHDSPRNLRRINPATNLVDLSVSMGSNSSYCWSSWMGTLGNYATAPGGVWTAVFDAGSTKQFARTSWHEEIQSGTSLTVRQRFANSQIALASQPWTNAVNGGVYGRVAARFAEVQGIFSRPFGSANTPILFDLSLEDLEAPMIVVEADCAGYVSQCGAEQGEVACAESEAGYVAPLGGGFA